MDDGVRGHRSSLRCARAGPVLPHLAPVLCTVCPRVAHMVGDDAFHTGVRVLWTVDGTAEVVRDPVRSTAVEWCFAAADDTEWGLRRKHAESVIHKLFPTCVLSVVVGHGQIAALCIDTVVVHRSRAKTVRRTRRSQVNG